MDSAEGFQRLSSDHQAKNLPANLRYPTTLTDSQRRRAKKLQIEATLGLILPCSVLTDHHARNILSVIEIYKIPDYLLR